MPTKNSRHALAKKRLKEFDENLESLLKSTKFRSLKELFRSKSFKTITVKKSKRHQKGGDMKLDAFFKTAVDRCNKDVTSRAYCCCQNAFGNANDSGEHRQDRKPRAAAEFVPKRMTRSKTSQVVKKDEDATSPQQEATVPKGKPKLTKSQKTQQVSDEQAVAGGNAFVSEEQELPIGLTNVGHKTCYAVSSWRVLSTLDSLYAKLADLHLLQPDHDSLANSSFDLIRSIRIGDRDGADAAFVRMLTEFGVLLPDWQDLSQLQDADEFTEAMVRQLQQECGLFGIDLYSDVFGCNATCNNCTLAQQAQGVVKQSSLQANYTKNTSEILSEIVLENICNCLACYGPCRCTSLPSNIFAKLNRHDLRSKLLPGAKLNVEEEVYLDFEELSGIYRLRGGILYHERKGTDNHYTSLMWQPQSHSYIVLDDEDVSKVSQSAAMAMLQKEAFLLHYELLGPSHHE